MLYRSFRYLVLSISSLAFLLVVPQVASACICAERPTALDAFERADEVVILRVVSVDKIENTANQYYVEGIRSTKMVVEKMFKGKLNVNDEIEFAQGTDSDCVKTFTEKSIGNQFLFYLSRPENLPRDPHDDSSKPGLWFVFRCGRSSELESAAADLLWLENRDKVKGKTRISGSLLGLRDSGVELEGRKVKFIGGTKTYETRTRKNGVFEIYDLPPGRYFVETEIPPGWKINAHSYRGSPNVLQKLFFEPGPISIKQLELTLTPKKKHTEIDIVFTEDNSVSGRVVGPRGMPVHGVCVYLLRAGQEPWERPYSCTDERGRFEITSIAEGEYVVAANPDNNLSVDDPFSRIFYPSVAERERATVIRIAPGETIENIDLVIPKLEETITIEGVLRYADGKPAADGSVKFIRAEDNQRLVTQTTDAEGRFRLRVLKGLTGKIFGEFTVYTNLFKNCPKVDELLAQSGRDATIVVTNSIKLPAVQSQYHIELALPFPQCERARK